MVDFLDRKERNQPLPVEVIHELEFYEHSPETLIEMYEMADDQDEWYFLTARNRRYPKSKVTARSAGDGCWSATVGEKEILDGNGSVIGYKRALDFYKGKRPNGVRTKRKMHEYRLHKE